MLDFSLSWLLLFLRDFDWTVTKLKKKKLFLRRRILILLDWYRSTFFFILFFYLNQLYGLAFWNCSRIRYWTAWERQGLAGANIVVSGEPANNLRVLTFSALWLRLTFQLSRFQLDCFRWMGVVVVVRSIHRLISFKVYDLQQPNFMYLLTDDWYVHTLENLGWNVCTHSLLTRSETVVVAFSSLSRIFGKCLIFIPCLRVFLSFFFKVEISLGTLIPLFMPGLAQSGIARWDSWSEIQKK